MIAANVCQQLPRLGFSIDLTGPASDEPRVKTVQEPRHKIVPSGNGPPLQFVVANTPSQFKEEGSVRTVRSQAMIYWRHTERTRQSTHQNSCSEVSPHELPVLGSQDIDGPVVLVWQASLLPSSPAALVPDDDHSHDLDFVTSRSRVTNYECSDSHEAYYMDKLLKSLPLSIDDGFDSFDILPKFDNPSLDSVFLLRTCKYRLSYRSMNHITIDLYPIESEPDVNRYARVCNRIDCYEVVSHHAVPSPSHP